MASHSSRRRRRRRRRAKSAANENPSPNWLELPPEITVAILHKVGAIDVLDNAQMVCMQWRTICKEPSMWRTIDMRNSGDCDIDELGMMCKHAVDKSCGALVDLNIEHFGSDELLDYITQRCTQIRRLRLVHCVDLITDKGLCEAAKRLPLLEDLEISHCIITAKALETIGECCPLLKTLKRNRRCVRNLVRDNDEAMVIAKHMPELRRLQLFGNGLTNKGLEAILEGCPHLESLDLRQCFNVYLGGHLGKRYAQRLKVFRRPFDPTDDYEFNAAVGNSPSYSDGDAMSELEELDNYQTSSSGSEEIDDLAGIYWEDDFSDY